MAKMKTFVVEVEIAIKRTVIVQARRPNGAIERLMDPKDDSVWWDGFKYEDPTDLGFHRDDAKVVRVREVGT